VAQGGGIELRATIHRQGPSGARPRASIEPIQWAAAKPDRANRRLGVMVRHGCRGGFEQVMTASDWLRTFGKRCRLSALAKSSRSNGESPVDCFGQKPPLIRKVEDRCKNSAARVTYDRSGSRRTATIDPLQNFDGLVGSAQM
jgi:hypothetical protein